MTIKQLIEKNAFKIINQGNDIDRKISKPYCCDLLSVAMCSMPEDCVWVTVMANINTLAVASLKDVSCILLAEGAILDQSSKLKAESEGLTVLSTEAPIFESAVLVSEMLNE